MNRALRVAVEFVVVMAFSATLLLQLTSRVDAASLGSNITTSPVTEVISSKPGTKTSVVLHVQNNNPQPVPIKISLYTFGAAGTSGKPALQFASSTDTFLSWAHFSPAAFVAQPDVPVAVTMTLNIPKTASLGYNYGIAFEPIEASTLNGPGAAVVGSNVVLILLDTTSGNEVHSIAVSGFTSDKKLYEYLPATFSVNIHNSGNIFLAPGGDIFISKASNFSPGSIIDTIPVNSGQGNILPNTNRAFTAQWADGFPVFVIKQVDGHEIIKNNHPVYQLNWNFSQANKLRFGHYYAKLIMSYSNGERQVPVTAILSFWVLPWKLLLILILLLLIFIGLIIFVIYLVHRLRRLQGKKVKRRARKP